MLGRKYFSRKIFLLLILILTTSTITVLTYLILNLNTSPRETFPEINQKIRVFLDDPETNRLITIINDDKQNINTRYIATTDIVMRFRSRYSASHNPNIRDFVMNDFNNFAKKNFEKEYVIGDFEIPCSDPECGHEITPEFKLIIKNVEKSPLPDYIKETVLYNLKVVAYKPVSDRFNSVNALMLTISQLNSGGIPEASEAANTLKTYLKKTYSIDYEKEISIIEKK